MTGKSKKEKEIIEKEIIENEIIQDEETCESCKECSTCEDEKSDEASIIERLNQEKCLYLDLAQRTKAEFDNFKKRNQTLRLDSINEGIRQAVTAVLPVIDNLERAMDAAEDHENAISIKEGVDMIFAQLLGVLEGLGLEEIPAKGEMFDPNSHHAVMQGEADEDTPINTIMEVFQKGYSLKNKIIRHSMVKVAK